MSEINGAFLCKRHQQQHLEFLTAFLRTSRKLNPSRCFGCAYEFRAVLGLLQSCSKMSSHSQIRSRRSVQAEAGSYMIARTAIVKYAERIR